MLSVVDANVLVLANGQSDTVVESCVDAAKSFVASVLNSGSVVVDTDGEVIEEYLRTIERSRPYGLGALFLIKLLQLQHDPKWVTRIDLRKDHSGAYLDFPSSAGLSTFDLSDRKFAVLARLTKCPVINAVDSDWVEFVDELEDFGISVVFLCGINTAAWFS